MAVDSKFCEKCKKIINIKEFYKTNNLKKYPDGCLNQCKKCTTMNVDNWDIETVLPILQECDVPYIQEVWANMLEKYGKNREKVSGMTIIGHYLATMKIKQHKDYRWADTDYIREKAENKIRETMKRQGYSAAEIDNVIATGMVSIPERPPQEEEKFEDYSGYENYFDNDQPEFDIDLTDEEKIMLRLKWGKAYRPDEWVQLEQLYKDMMESYDITAAGDINSLKMMCKASLKANQLMDIGDK